MARAGAPYRSANSGELAPEAAGRMDVKQFYAAGLRFKNVEPVPLSGFRDMPGSVDVGMVRPVMAALAQSSVNSARVSLSATLPGYDRVYGADVSGDVAAIDCAELSVASGTATVRAQVWKSGVWTYVGNAHVATPERLGCTFAFAPGEAVAATAMRIVVVESAGAMILGAVTVLQETEEQAAPRYSSVLHDDGSRYFSSLQPEFMDIYEADGFVAGVYLPGVIDAVQPYINFYAESATFGLANRNMRTQRVRRSGASTRWVRDNWPYDGLPTEDLGGSYSKISDRWEIEMKWTDTPKVYVTVTVNGESTPGIPFVDAGGTVVAIGSANNAKTGDDLQAALEDLPSLGAGVTVSIADLAGEAKRITLTFAGDLSGAEYQVSAMVTNTATASALATHTRIGETEYEPLFSSTRGWPGVFGLVYDRLQYGDIKAVPSAFCHSASGNYFNLDTQAAGDSAARLDKLRAGEVAERVLGFIQSTHPLLFTNLAVHFAPNRTITASDPLTMAQTASSGIVPWTTPVYAEQKIYYVGGNPKQARVTGHQLLSLSFSEIDGSFEPVPEHIFAPHLVSGVIRFKAQVASDKADATRLWMLREDGRVAVANIILTQDVLGFCEWVLAAGGAAQELHVDNANDVRVAVLRGGKLRHEKLSRATVLQAARNATPDLAGGIAGLDPFNGLPVWVADDGRFYGPYVVEDGAIDTGETFTGPVSVGLWQPPVWESMPRYFITRNDEVVKRPGRITAVRMNVMDTQSIAVGANGGLPENIPLQRVSDDLTVAPVPFTGAVEREGILGRITGTTAVVTQLRPGHFYVRDMTIEESL